MVATGTINITNCKLYENKVINGDGGAIGIDTHGTVIVHDCSLVDNSAAVNGGAFGGNGKATITKCTVDQNTARYGGAIGCYNEMTVARSILRKNSAEYGGAVFCSGGTIKVSNSSLHENSAAYGGALFNYGILEIEQCAITSNSATATGGGIGTSNNGTLAIVNSTVSGNRASTHGGGLLVYQATATLTFVTIAFNTAINGAGIFEFDGALNVINSIIGRNQGSDCLSQMNQNIRNLIEDGSCNPALSGDPLLGPLTGDPAFHPLLKGSPAIDAAHPDYHEPVDQRGIARPQGKGIDIGACEYVFED